MNIDDIFLNNINSNQSIIDLVYTFVDPSDSRWQQKYEIHTGSKKIDKTRFDFSNEQLIFSLYTIKKYMPWVNKIYIVHDDQKFDIKSSFLKNKIVWVDHKEIIPKNLLPTFNSMIIEAFLWNIPNIGKYFLYLNDDMFLGATVSYKDFFDNFSKKPIQFYVKCHYYNHSWMRNIKNTNELFKKIYINHQDLCPQHAPYFIQTSIMKETYDKFSSYLEHMFVTDKKRTYSDYAHNLLFLYAMYSSYNNYVINKKTSFSPLFSLTPETISKLNNKKIRKKFYCFFSPVKTEDQKRLYKKLQQTILS